MKRNSDTISIERQTSGKLPSLPFSVIKGAVLGKKYQLSLVFPTRNLAQELHKKYKHKSGPANILSFPLSKNEGEIFISLESARKEAKNFERSYPDHLLALFIHGCAHLRGHTHGGVMEKFEKKMQYKFLGR